MDPYKFNRLTRASVIVNWHVQFTVIFLWLTMMCCSVVYTVEYRDALDLTKNFTGSALGLTLTSVYFVTTFISVLASQKLLDVIYSEQITTVEDAVKQIQKKTIFLIGVGLVFACDLILAVCQLPVWSLLAILQVPPALFQLIVVIVVFVDLGLACNGRKAASNVVIKDNQVTSLC